MMPSIWEQIGQVGARLGPGLRRPAEDEAEDARQAWLNEAMRRDAREMLVRTGGIPAVDLPGADLEHEDLHNYSSRWPLEGPAGPPSSVDQQLQIIESRVGPLTGDTRDWIAEGLSSGTMTLGQAAEAVSRLREDWRP